MNRRRLWVLLVALAILTGSSAVGVSPVPAASTGPSSQLRFESEPATTSFATQGRPFVIVLDTSSSMADDDGAGTIKLAGAQAALTDVIRNQRPGASLGLWSYPHGGGGGCASGRFEVPVDQVDQRSMIAKVRSLEADGDTPTGPALRRVAGSLQKQGYDGATLLLVSDGESNCGEAPCAVAKQIVRDGFDLTVSAAGFQISGAGLRELECIASATGGQAFEVEDSAQLQEVVEQAGQAYVAIDVHGIPTTTPAGSSSRVQVTVQNVGSVDIVNARIAVSFANGGFDGPGIVPAVLPPLVSLGNLPAGRTATREWVVGYGTRGKTGTAGWRISAWGLNAQPAVREGTVEVVDQPLALADAGGPLSSLQGKTVAILGDSFSSGEGAGDYDPSTDVDDTLKCHRSLKTYLAPLFPAEDVLHLACSGATSTVAYNKSYNGLVEVQKPQLYEQAAERAVDAAFLTIGGNDIGFSDIIKQCVVGHPRLTVDRPRFTQLLSVWGLASALPQLEWSTRCVDDPAFAEKYESLIDNRIPELTDTYVQVMEALNSSSALDQREGQVAPLYVLGYPQVFPEAQWVSFCPFFDPYEVDWANSLVDRLNDRIEAAVERAAGAGWRIAYVDTIQESFLPDSTACPRPSTPSFMNALDEQLVSVVGDREVQEFMHPNALGYRAETNRLVSWSVQEAPVEPAEGWRTSRERTLVARMADSRLGEALALPLPAATPLDLDVGTGAWLQEAASIRAGQDFEIRVSGAAPGSTVLVVVESRPRPLGSVAVGADGTGAAVFRLPRTLVPGDHHLVALGADASGDPVVAAVDVDVSRAVPKWMTLVLLATLLLVLAWAGCRLWERRAVRGNT